MLEFVRKAYQEFIGAVRSLDEKLDIVLHEVRVRNAEHDVILAQLNYLIAVERENRVKREEQEQKERLSIIMPGTEETM